MRFERITIERFGRLREVDTGAAPLPGLVVVTGPNEAGKSTFFQLLTTLLYGFYPASREGNEYAPWDGGDASGSAVIRLGSDERVEVERRLLSSPAGSLVRNGRDEELRNRSLPFVDHVPRTVFGQVFALTLSELAGLDDETWGRIQDRLLGAMGAAELRPAREVADELEQEAGSLWRPNRRGNQRIRELQAEIRELRSRRREASERDAELRATTRRRDEARERLEEAREERQRERLAVERVQSLLPVRAQLRRIADLEAEAGPEEELEGLPSHPGKELERLEDRVEELRARSAEIEEEMEAPTRTVDEVGEEERALLDRRRDVSAFAARATSWATDRSRLRSLSQELRDLDRRLASVAEEILATSWEDVPRGPVLALAPPELRDAVRDARRAREDRRAREAALEEGPPSAPSSDRALRMAGLTVLVLGASLAGVAWMAALPLALLPAAVAVGVGVYLLLGRSGTRAPGERETPGPLEEARTREAKARERVARLLRDVPVAPGRLEEPDEGLASGVERLQELLRDRQERAEARRTLAATLEQAAEEAGRLATALGRDASMEPEALAGLLEGELRRAERRHDAAESARRELARLERERERVEKELGEAEAAARELRGRLLALGEDDVARGVRRARARLEAAQRAGQLRDELGRSHPELDELRTRIQRAEDEGEPWTRDDDDLARRKARIETLTGEIEELARDAERMEQELRRMLDQETVDAVDGEIATLQEEESRLLAERDRRWILARLVREADRRFREEHQPDLLRRAGAHLSELTGGRYRRMVADDGAGEHRFHLVPRDRNDLVPMAPPVSTGTLEQAYLALRLAIVDHLDEGHERLPLFLDEALVNWDPPRRDRGLQVLAELSRSRQVFFFTCHPPMAARLEALGAHRFDLGAA